MNGQRAGFIYVLTNPSIPELVKIGQTERHPAARVAELSSHEGVALPFALEFYIEVADRFRAEAAIHEALAAFRVSTDREFFKLNAAEAQSIIREIGGRFSADPDGRWTHADIAMLRAGRCPACSGNLLIDDSRSHRVCAWCKLSTPLEDDLP